MSRRTFLGGLAVAATAAACGQRPPATGIALDRRKVAYGTHPLQVGDLTVPTGRGPRPVVVLLHGGYWKPGLDRTTLTPMADALGKAGFAAWNLDYRTIGVAGGGWRGTFEDVATGIDELDRLPDDVAAALDLDRLVVMGHSAGGQLALWAASRDRTAVRGGRLIPVRGVVSFAGVCDLVAAASSTATGTNEAELRQAVTDLLGGPPEGVPERYARSSPRALLPLGVPQLLVHGDRDDRVPIQQSRDHAAAAVRLGDQARLIEMPTGDHGDITRPDRAAWNEVVSWLNVLTSPV